LLSRALGPRTRSALALLLATAALVPAVLALLAAGAGAAAPAVLGLSASSGALSAGAMPCLLPGDDVRAPATLGLIGSDLPEASGVFAGTRAASHHALPGAQLAPIPLRL
jgi:hypothetical protein